MDRSQLRPATAAMKARLAAANTAAAPSHRLPPPRAVLPWRRRRRMAAMRDGGSNSAANLFDNNFVAPLVMRYMDVPTLVAFASTNRSQARHLLDEVRRRKERVQQLHEEIQALVRHLRPLSPLEVREALARQDEARRLVDSGLDWLCPKNHVQDRLEVDGVSCGTCRRDRLFLAERLVLKPHSLRDLAETCPLLPLLFYAPSMDGKSNDDVTGLVTDASLREMRQLVAHLWTGERLSYSRKHADQVMGEVVRDRSSPSSNPYACNLDCPLRIVEARSQRHTSCSRYDMEEVHHQLVGRTANRLAGDGAAVESFRFACRLFVKVHPLSLPFLLWILTEIEAEQKKEIEAHGKTTEASAS